MTEKPRRINVIKADFTSPFYKFHITNIRRKVFVEEQGVAREEEFDQFEDESQHFLVMFGYSKAGTARWRTTGDGIKLERFAVLPKHRNSGVGSALVKAVLFDVMDKGKKIYLHAQLRAIPLYERNGFVKEGNMFSECNIDHFKMVYKPS
ncbi:MAG: GNAT family N-acetyltransferase [Bacteroidota bacterium]